MIYMILITFISLGVLHLMNEHDEIMNDSKEEK